MSARAPVLAALLLLVAMSPLAAADASTPAGAWSDVKAALKAGDADGARATYDDAFAARFSTLDPQLAAGIDRAFADFRAAGPGSVERALASQVIDKGILHGAWLATEDAIFREEDAGAAEPWFGVLRSKFGAATNESYVAFEQMRASSADFRDHREEFRALVLGIFAGKVREEIEETLLGWEDPTERQVKATEGVAYYGPLHAGVERILGLAPAEELRQAIDALAQAAASGDRAAADAAAGDALMLLDSYEAGGAQTGATQAVSQFLSAVKLVVNEYDAYVRDGVVVDEDGYYHEILHQFLPNLRVRWNAAQADLAAEKEHIELAITNFEQKVRALAPNEDVRRAAKWIEAEVAEVTGAQHEEESSFDAAATEFRDRLDGIAKLHAAGDRDAALSAITSAYLDVYGPKLEPFVVSADRGLNTEIERLLHEDLRAAIANGESVERVNAIVAGIDERVENAGALLDEPRSGVKAFIDSFLIIVREGFEAMLVVGALATYLIRTKNAEKTRPLYWGAALGIVASFALWLVVRAVLEKLPVNQEVMEGVVALVAMVVLFYVSYWLISKVEVGKWNRFIQGKMKGALARGSAFALGGVAFLAVFREGFETVLFYQGLFVANATQGSAVVGGLVAGAVVLAVAALAFYRFGVKLPLRPFFIGTSILLYYLAFSFMGAGIHELQEGGVVATTLIPSLADALRSVPALETVSELFGIFPTVETLVAQSLLLAAVAAGLLWTLVVEPRRAVREGAIEG